MRGLGHPDKITKRDQVKNVKEIWSRVVAAMRGRYVCGLEDEVARLRAENRALMNSLLGTAGIPPLGPDAPQWPVASSVRRRSWPQIAMAREIEEMRKGPARRAGAEDAERSERATA
ncbi:MAG TPA: hypothetical protein VFO34_13475 [Candidatus Acidoferrales bacterium]|nr:hypothetical protein [Candidatus Acidoferrales bacterium]